MRHGGIVFGATLAVNLATFAFHFYFSRTLGVRGYGALYSVINIASFITVIAGVLTVIVTKIVADIAMAKQSLGAVVRKVLYGSTLLALIFALAVVSVTVPAARFLHVEPLVFVLLALFAATQIVLAAARGIAQGTQMFAALAWSLAIEGVLRTVLAISFVHFLQGVVCAVAAYSLGAIMAIWYTIVVVRTVHSVAGKAPLFDIAGILRTSFAITVSSLAIAVLSTADVVLARHYFTNEQSGIYGAVALAGKTLFFAVSFLPMILLPKAGEAATRGTSKQLLSTAGAMMLGLSGAALVLFFAAPHTIVRIMAGAGYDAAAGYIFPYAGAMAALGAANGVAAYRMGLSDFSYVWFAVVLATAECVAIAIFHHGIRDVVVVVGIVSTVLLMGLIVGLRKALVSPVPPAQTVVLFQEELEVH